MRREAFRRPAAWLWLLLPVCLVGTQAGASPWEASISLGGHVAPSPTVSSRSDDRASICDEYINPQALGVIGCTTPDRGAGDGWLASFDGDEGISVEMELGYRLWPRVRVALAYSYHVTGFDQTVSSTDASGADFDKISNELSTGVETLDAVRSHEIFLMGFYDWPTRGEWKPYVGLGAGVSWMRMEFSWLWARSADPRDIVTGAGQPNAEEIRRNLAGTVSVGGSVLRDVVAGYVLEAGVERTLSDALTAGFKVQWKRFGTFESGAYQGDLLRSHAPNLRLDGSEPVSTWSRTDDLGRLSVMLTLRYALP